MAIFKSIHAGAVIDAAITKVVDLASSLTGKGASLIAIEDVDGNYTSTNVEGALKESADILSNLAANNLKYAEYTLSANQSIANSATPGPLSWGTKTAINSEEFTALDTGSVKILEAGVYEVCASVVFGSSTTGLRGLYGAANGVRKGNSSINASSSTTGLTISFFVNASVNDLITAYVMQTSGGALDVVNDTRYTYLQIRKVG